MNTSLPESCATLSVASAAAPSVDGRTVATERRWRREEFWPSLAPVRGWLLDDGSLTQRLLRTGRAFSLERWQQRWEAPTHGERRLLAMGQRERAMVRQIVMRLDGVPVVFARSVFPVTSLTGSLLRLRRLENQSLGSFLFARSDMRRSPFEIARLEAGDGYLPESLRQAAPCWARRSCFMVSGRTLLVSEVFLRDFPSWQSPMPLHRSRRGRVSVTIGRCSR